MNSKDELRDITNEIFELTGKKVDVDDPIVVAALFYTERFRSACEEQQQALAEAQKSLEQSFANIVLKAAVDLQAAATTQRREDGRAFDQVLLAAKQAALSQLPAMRHELTKHVAKAALPSRGTAPALGVYATFKTMVAMSLLLVASGFTAGYLWFGASKTEAATAPISTSETSASSSTPQTPRASERTRLGHP